MVRSGSTHIAEAHRLKRRERLVSGRINCAETALATYVMERGQVGDLGEDITDLIADLLHLASAMETGDKPETIHRLAWVHFMTEERDD